MKTSELKTISENLIGTFKSAGKVSIDLYKKGLKIEIKEDQKIKLVNCRVPVPISLHLCRTDD